MGIRDAFSAVPAKPIITVAVVITATVAGWHWWSVRDLCTGRAALSKSLMEWSRATLAGNKQARLDQATGFEWDHVRIFEGVAKPVPSQNCPFGWHWNNDRRGAMARAGNLTQIGFFRENRLVEMADFDRRWVSFGSGDAAISRDAAVFLPATDRRTLKRAKPK